MQLLIDFGNSRIKWARWEAGELQYGGDALYHGQELAKLFDSWWGDLGTPLAIICASVASAEHDRALEQWCQRQWQQPISWLQTVERQLGVRNAYAEPYTLGSDRWAALIAAHHLSSHHVGIISCGSAVTVDLLRADGTHNGGYIVPGLRMMQQCLLAGTGRVSVEPVIAGQTTPGNSSETCVSHGALLAITALLNQLMGDLRPRYDNRIEWLLTGGDAMHIQPHLEHACRMVPDLVLQGLACIAQGNE